MHSAFGFPGPIWGPEGLLRFAGDTLPGATAPTGHRPGPHSMCGIHGLLSLSGHGEVLPEHLTAMGAATIHRGPDDEGQHLAPGLGLGMRRLSIIDLAGGHQPISNEDGTLHLVCNGEIYNYRELREELLARGHQFKTASDVEVILHLYEEEGDACVARLNGMFGFALHDQRRGRVLIARDQLGVKPLYIARSGDWLAFASEVKGILALPMFSASLRHEALPHYLELGYVPAPFTMFEGIDKLPVGARLVIENGQVREETWWRPDFTPEEASPEEWAARTRAAIEAAVKRQMVADVPIGAFLSGGIDSSAVVAMMAAESSQPVRTYSIGFDTGAAGKFYNELPYAREIAERFGTQHKEIVVRPDVVSLLPKLLWHLDEPLADSASMTTFLVSEFARKDVTVILSGVGGDELFGGYRRYLGEHYAAKYQRIPGFLRRGLLRPLACHLPADRHSKWLNRLRLAKSFIESAERPFEERYHAYVEVFGRAEREALLPDAAPHRSRITDLLLEKPTEDPLWRMVEVDRQSQLPDDLLMLTDKMSMATSLECRVPLLDLELVRLAHHIPGEVLLEGGVLKRVLKQSLEGVLPHHILHRAKRGFGAPMGAWLKEELSGLRRVLLGEEAVRRRGLFRYEPIAATIAEHDSKKADHTDHLLALLNLELWCRLFLDGESPDDLRAALKEAL